MKLNRWILGAVTAIGLAAGQHCYAGNNYKSEKTVGLTAGYHSCNRSAIAGVEFTYRFSKHFRIAPEVLYVFRNNNKDALCLNINADVPFPLSERWEVYPFAGITYSSWTRHRANRQLSDDPDVGDRTSRLGINAGAGANLNIASSLRLGVSACYTAVREYNGVEILASIAYRF